MHLLGIGNNAVPADNIPTKHHTFIGELKFTQIERNVKFATVQKYLSYVVQVTSDCITVCQHVIHYFHSVAEPFQRNVTAVTVLIPTVIHTHRCTEIFVPAPRCHKYHEKLTIRWQRNLPIALLWHCSKLVTFWKLGCSKSDIWGIFSLKGLWGL